MGCLALLPDEPISHIRRWVGALFPASEGPKAISEREDGPPRTSSTATGSFADGL